MKTYAFHDKTLIFLDLTWDEAQELLWIARQISFDGVINWEHPMVEAWVARFVHTESSKLLMVSTVFVPRAYESVVRTQQSRSL